MAYEFALVLILDIAPIQLHRIPDGSIAPGILDRDGNDRVFSEGVGGSEDVNVGFEIEAVVVHGAGQTVVDTITCFSPKKNE